MEEGADAKAGPANSNGASLRSSVLWLTTAQVCAPCGHALFTETSSGPNHIDKKASSLQPASLLTGVQGSKPAPAPVTRKLFVGGLSAATQEPQLRAAFAPYGEVEEAVHISSCGRPRGFGFVVFSNAAGAA